ncbi:unnamed protein product [Oikopleura dioica]|uniref:lysoplasmalogenase n=1 Tax=Oikopleura dioica TaxID=34765 RepID=E4WVB7_OIKDI|nr:unnamed protein product [Oikopleura dioica]
MLEFLFIVFSTIVTCHAEFLDADDTRWVRVLTKWIPCLHLAIMIQNEKHKAKCIPGAPTTIQVGLFFSAIGDVFLVYGMYENYFIAGVCFFGIAQMFYTMSFGWEICNYVSMMMMVSANYILQRTVIAEIQDEKIHTMVVGYSVLLTFMGWRAVDAAAVPDASGMERIYSLLGGIVFVISDLLIAVNQFVRPVPNHKFYILSTYFFAQFCLAQWSICKAQRMPKIKSN